MKSVSDCFVVACLRSFNRVLRLLALAIMVGCAGLLGSAYAAFPSLVSVETSMNANRDLAQRWTLDGATIEQQNFGSADFDGDGLLDPIIQNSFDVTNSMEASCNTYFIAPSSKFDTTALSRSDTDRLITLLNVNYLSPDVVEDEYYLDCYGSYFQIIDDINGDGLGEFMVSNTNFQVDRYLTHTAIIFGSTESNYSVDFSSPIPASVGFKIPENFYAFGLGDMNGDNIGELLLVETVVYTDEEFNYNSTNRVSIAAGRNEWPDNWFGSNELLSAVDVVDFQPLGDINGDGLQDVAFDTSNAYPEAGMAEWQLLYGSTSNKLTQFVPFELCAQGACVFSSVGQFNNDRFSDVMFSTYSDGETQTVILYGSEAGLPTTLEDGNHTTINNLLSYTPGWSVPNSSYSFYYFFSLISKYGNLNGDDLADILITDSEGVNFVLFGQNEAPAAVDVTQLNGHNGLVLLPRNYYYEELELIDATGDGLDDIVNDVGEVVLVGSAEEAELESLQNITVAYAPSTLFISWQPVALTHQERVQIAVNGEPLAQVPANDGYFELSDFKADPEKVLTLKLVNDLAQSSPSVSLPFGNGVSGILDLEAAVYSDNALELFWGGEPSVFSIWRNGQLLTTITGNSFYDDTVQPNTEYRYRVTETKDTNPWAIYDYLVTHDSLFNCESITTEVRKALHLSYMPASTDVLAVNTSDGAGLYDIAATSQLLGCGNTTLPSPTGLYATVYSLSSLELFWDRIEGVPSMLYEVSRNNELMTITEGTSFFDDTVSAYEFYEYSIVAIDAETGEQSSPAIVTQFVDIPADYDNSLYPETPGNLNGIVYSNSALELFWERASGSDGLVSYDIYRNNQIVGTVNGSSFFDDNLQAGTRYAYEIYPVINENYGSSAAIVLFTTGSNAGQEPSEGNSNPGIMNLRGSVYSNSALEVFWDRSESLVENGVYSVFRNNEYIGETNGNSFFDNSLSANTTYTYQITATLTNSASIISDSLSLTTNP